MAMRLLVALMALATLSAGVSNAQTTIYVDDDAPQAGADGATWQTAFPFLQDALAAAAPLAGTPVEIRVAQGEYRPDQGAGVMAGDRDASFELLSSTTLRGGFRGLGGVIPSTPGTEDDNDPVLYVSHLIGDLLGNDGPGFTGRDDNSFNIIFIDFGALDITINGFEISGGDAGSPIFGEPARRKRGGALHCLGNIITIQNSRFIDNRAFFIAGAVYFRPEIQSAELLIDQCEFFNNHAFGSAGEGGAMSIVTRDARITNSIFAGNRATNDAGAVYISYRGGPKEAAVSGYISGCLFTENVAGINGGAVQGFLSTIRNCTFVNNQGGVDLPKGFRSGAAVWMNRSSLANCIFLGNTHEGVPDALALLETGGPSNSFEYCIFMGGVDSIDTDGLPIVSSFLFPDPMTTTLFVDPLGPDGMPATGDEDYTLAPNSPAIDAGNSDALPRDIDDLDNDGITNEALPFDLNRTARRADVPGVPDTGIGEFPIVDIGAYEVDACQDCPGDRSWQNLAGGVFSSQSNWFPGIPGIGNTAVFDLGAIYTITANSNIETFALRAEQGDVTLDLQGFDYILGALFENPIIVANQAGDSASLTIEDGFLTSESGIIGLGSGSIGNLIVSGSDGPADWFLQQDLIVGFQGTADLTIEAGAVVSSLGGTIGSQPGSLGSAIVQGPGSLWDVPFVLEVQNGSLEIRDDATVNAGIGSFGGVIVLTNGEVLGDGTITGGLLNFGAVTPASPISALDPDPLTITGDYQQVGQIQQFGNNLGSLNITITNRIQGQTVAPLEVHGNAFLGGSLVVNFVISPMFSPMDGDRFAVMNAGLIDLTDSQFDVAFFQGFLSGVEDDLLMTLEYGPGLRGAGESVTVVASTVAAALNLGDPIGSGDVAGMPQGAAVGDLNQDGFDDLAVVVPNETPGANGEVAVFINAGVSGTTWLGYSQFSIPVGVDPSSVAIGNLDMDGGLDLVVTNRADDNAMVFLDPVLNAGALDSTIDLTVGSIGAPAGVILVDLDGDGFDDLAVIGEDATALPGADGLVLASINLSAGPAFGGFDVALTNAFGVGNRPVYLASSDLDQDKDLDLDLMVVNSLSDSVTTLLNQGNGGGGAWLGLGGRVDHNVGDNPVWLAAGDLDQIAGNDLLVANQASDEVSVLLNTGSGVFAPASSLPVGVAPRSIALVDLDQDTNGDLDVAIVLNDGTDDVIRILRNDLDTGTGQLAFTQTVDLLQGSSPLFVFTGDLDNLLGDDLISVNDLTGAPIQKRGAPVLMDIEVLLTASCVGDLNSDLIIDTADLGTLISQFGTAGPEADINGDGVVDTADLGTLIGQFGGNCN